MLPLNHHGTPGVDVARARWIIAACNSAMARYERVRRALLAGEETPQPVREPPPERCTTCGLSVDDPNHQGSPPSCPGPGLMPPEAHGDACPICKGKGEVTLAGVRYRCGKCLGLGDNPDMSDEEVDAFLRANGIDPDAAYERLRKRIKERTGHDLPAQPVRDPPPPLQSGRPARA